MSNHNDANRRRKRKKLPQEPTPLMPPRDVPPAPAPRPEVQAAPQGPVLERLGVMLTDALRDLNRLREENELLSRRVTQLENELGRPSLERFLEEEGISADELRLKLDTYISALNAHLAGE